MNPTIASVMASLNLKTKAEFARYLGLPKQSMTGRNGEDAVPDAWCWRLANKRPDLFGPASAKKRPPSHDQSEAA